MATMEELANQVAHATTGKDVRGAIAEGFGQFDQVKGEVFRRVKAVEDDNAMLNARVDNLSDDLAAEAKARKVGDDNEARDRRAADTEEAQNRKIADGKLDNRLNRLDQEKATHDDVNDLRGEMYQIRDDWHDRASHIARGTDVETTKAVVEQILQEKGLI